MSRTNLIKVILIVLFLLCLMDMPYGFYELVRFIAMFGFIYLAVENYKSNKKKVVLIYLALALLFQPFFKIALGRLIWNIVDVILAIGLTTTIIYSQKRNKDFQINL
jgi:predicted membrane protein